MLLELETARTSRMLMLLKLKAARISMIFMLLDFQFLIKDTRISRIWERQDCLLHDLTLVPNSTQLTLL